MAGIRVSCKDKESLSEIRWVGAVLSKGWRRSLRPVSPPSRSKPLVKFWEFPNLSAGLRQIFPDASVRCPPSPLGGAAPGAERGKRERAGGLSSHAREATAVRPASAAAAHLAPIAGRSQDGGAGGAVLREGGRRGR